MTSANPLLTYRDAVRKLSPSWLQIGLGEQLMYAIVIQLDALTDSLVSGVKARFPGLDDYYESLATLGRERRIIRGRYDVDASYAERLKRWLDDHQTRGGPYALLNQLHYHFAPNNFQIDLYYRSGRHYEMAVDGTVTRDDVAFPFADSKPEQWARWWLLYQWPEAVGKRQWGDGGKWGDGGVWGSDLTPANVADLRAVPRSWNALHARGAIVLETPDATVYLSMGG